MSNSEEIPARSEVVTRAFEQKIDELQEDVETLGVIVKYLLFDVEATRREKAAVEKRLDDLMQKE